MKTFSYRAQKEPFCFFFAKYQSCSFFAEKRWGLWRPFCCSTTMKQQLSFWWYVWVWAFDDSKLPYLQNHRCCCSLSTTKAKPWPYCAIIPPMKVYFFCGDKVGHCPINDYCCCCDEDFCDAYSLDWQPDGISFINCIPKNKNGNLICGIKR